MKKLPINELKTDEILDGEIYLTESHSYLITGFALPFEKNTLELLQNWQFKELYTDGSGAVISSKAGSVSGAIGMLEKEANNRAAAQATYTELCKKAAVIYASYINKGELLMNNVVDLIKEIVTLLKKHKAFMLRFNDFEGLCNNYFIAHAVETTILSLALGEALKFNNPKLNELGLAAFLHEIGILRLPREIQNSLQT
ncbi:MAG: hypothetical protein FWE37_05515, partial [Spirochaetaceae bacterium]|nr:hypothetical protein [Spirochaetaceae bacterium]